MLRWQNSSKLTLLQQKPVSSCSNAITNLHIVDRPWTVVCSAFRNEFKQSVLYVPSSVGLGSREMARIVLPSMRVLLTQRFRLEHRGNLRAYKVKLVGFSSIQTSTVCFHRFCTLFYLSFFGSSWLRDHLHQPMSIPIADRSNWHDSSVSRPPCQGSGDCRRRGDAR